MLEFVKRAVSYIASLLLLAVASIPAPVRDVERGNIKEKAPQEDKVFATRREALANGGGWYVTMNEDFGGDDLPDTWIRSPHYKRNTEWWCDEMVRVEDGMVKIDCVRDDSHVCGKGICPSEGVFTSGIETRGVFEQAFGYYEVRVLIPNADGLWSAFWFQSSNMGMVGNQGRDGSEIDVFESAFWQDKQKVGHCIHWDGYADNHQSHGTTVDTGIDLYEGWHTYGLLWTPEKYVFFVDGEPTWETRARGVSRVPEFMRLTIESRPPGPGPYGTVLGEMINTPDNPATFCIDSVKVYQHTCFEPRIRANEDFIQAPWIK